MSKLIIIITIYLAAVMLFIGAGMCTVAYGAPFPDCKMVLMEENIQNKRDGFAPEAKEQIPGIGMLYVWKRSDDRRGLLFGPIGMEAPQGTPFQRIGACADDENKPASYWRVAIEEAT